MCDVAECSCHLAGGHAGILSYSVSSVSRAQVALEPHLHQDVISFFVIKTLATVALNCSEQYSLSLLLELKSLLGKVSYYF